MQYQAIESNRRYRHALAARARAIAAVSGERMDARHRCKRGGARIAISTNNGEVLSDDNDHQQIDRAAAERGKKFFIPGGWPFVGSSRSRCGSSQTGSPSCWNAKTADGGCTRPYAAFRCGWAPIHACSRCGIEINPMKF